MLDTLKRFFGQVSGQEGAVGEDNREHDIKVATCALFLEMCKIDETFSPEEMEKLLGILKTRYDLSPEHAEALIQEADRELNESVDYWQFAQQINDHYSVAEKIEIIETLWEIVYVDGIMDKHENYLMHKLGKLLRLDHKQLIDAKLKAKRAIQTA